MSKKEQFSLPVFSTEDYNIFSTLTGNRDVYPRHVRRLVRVLEKNPTFTRSNPIRVNKNMEVIDGQHRLAAFKSFADRNGEYHPVFYIVQDGSLEDAKSLNAGSKPWGPADYAKAYAASGN